MIYGISDQFCGHGPGYKANPGEPEVVRRTERQEEIVERINSMPEFARQGHPGAVMQDGIACLVFERVWPHAAMVYTPIRMAQ